MSIELFTTKFSNIGEQIFLRCDPKYRHFWDNSNGQVLKETNANIPLKDIISPLHKQVLRKGPLFEECFLLGIDTSEPRDGQLRNLPAAIEIKSDKLLLKDADIIITKLGTTRGYIFENNLKGQNLIGSTELIPYKLINDSYLPAFLKYLLLLPPYLSAYAYLESGKTPSHWRVNPLDLLRIKIPEIRKDLQLEILQKVEPIQKRINALKDGLSNSVEIINRVFAREFRYSLREYEKRAKKKTYQRSFSALDKVFLLRGTVKFQHPKYDYLDEILKNYPWIKLKTVCSEPIHRGVQPKYDTNGEVLVVKTINLKHEILDFSESERVALEFFEVNKGAEIKENDILVSSTGEGRGKVDIYELEEPGIGDTHISIIRLKDDINPYYVLYFMRSLLGKLQLETLEIAIKGTPEIYSYQLAQMRIIAISPKKQELIVNEIQEELKELQKQKAEIERIRGQIDEIFLQAIMKEDRK